MDDEKPRTRRQRLVGAVVDGLMQLSRQGTAAERMWLEIAGRSPGITVDVVVAMPDHVHGTLMTVTNRGIETSASIEDIVHAFKIRFRAAYRSHVDAGACPPYVARL